MSVICYKWGGCNIQWNLANWTWSECQLVSDIISGFGPGAPPAFPDWLTESSKDEEKKRRFIRLLCKVKNEPKFDETKEVKNIKIKIEDIKIVVKAVSGIDIDIKEEI